MTTSAAPSAALQLAELVLSMEMVTPKGQLARSLARQVLGVADAGSAGGLTAITTNGTTRVLPRDEPVFLIRGQDQVGADTVRAWADLAAAAGAAPSIVSTARAHAGRMQAWAVKKLPDLPAPDWPAPQAGAPDAQA